MNERIKELWKKSNGAAVPPEGFYSSASRYNIEKFAEIIVQECVEQVEQAKNSPFVSLDDAKRMAHFVDVTKKKVQKHFGVE